MNQSNHTHKLCVTKEGIDIRKEVKKLLEETRELSDLKGHYNQFALEVDDMADALFYRIIDNLKEKYQDDKLDIDNSLYPHSDRRSIPWEILSLLKSANSDILQYEELPVFEKFLSTPPGKELEGWKDWEDYWKNRKIPEDTRIQIELSQDDYPLEPAYFFEKMKEIAEDQTLSDQDTQEKVREFNRGIYRKARQYFEEKYGTEFINIMRGNKVKRDKLIWVIYDAFQWSSLSSKISKKYLIVFLNTFRDGKHITRKTVNQWCNFCHPGFKRYRTLYEVVEDILYCIKSFFSHSR